MANGLEPAEWTGPLRTPEFLAGSPTPLLVYAGTLDSRLDIGWIEQAASELREATVLLVGPLVEPDHLRPLESVENVRIHPELGREELAGLIRSADVGLIPHRRTPLTEAMSPLKLYEYLAGGLPVLASDLEPMRGVGPRVVLVEEGADFGACLRVALALGRADEETRLGFVGRELLAQPARRAARAGAGALRPREQEDRPQRSRRPRPRTLARSRASLASRLRTAGRAVRARRGSGRSQGASRGAPRGGRRAGSRAARRPQPHGARRGARAGAPEPSPGR